jgi:hypothetical protein
VEKHLATASSGLMSIDSTVEESNAKRASASLIAQAVRISSEMAIVPPLGSTGEDPRASGCVAVTPGVGGVLAAGGLAVAHAVTRNRGAIETTSAQDLGADEIGFMVSTSGECVTLLSKTKANTDRRHGGSRRPKGDLRRRATCFRVRDWHRDERQSMRRYSNEACSSPSRARGGHRAQAATGRTLAHRFIAGYGVLLVQPAGPLRAMDFDAIAVDPWGEICGNLRGLVVQADEFPGWENLAGFVRHVQVARGHRDAVRRVALATDVDLPHVRPELTNHLIRADLRRFGYFELGTAISWAAS